MPNEKPDRLYCHEHEEYKVKDMSGNIRCMQCTSNTKRLMFEQLIDWSEIVKFSIIFTLIGHLFYLYLLGVRALSNIGFTIIAGISLGATIQVMLIVLTE